MSLQRRRLTRRVPTPEDWAPTHRDGTVRGSVYLGLEWQRPGRWSVILCFWGEDDHGMERVTRYLDEDAAAALYQREAAWLCGLALVQQATLRALGFVPA